MNLKNKPGMTSMKKMKKSQKKRERDLRKKSNGAILKAKKKRSHEEEETLNKIAHDLSIRFSYTQLSRAVNGKAGFEVHGHMEQTYLNYDWLITKMVLDRACFYAKRDTKPELIKLITEFDAGKYERSVVEASVPVTLENYPAFPFEKAIVYSEKHLNEGIHWLDNYPWVLEGYDTFIQLGPANLALLGWSTWNMPIFLVLHAPGKNQALWNAKMNVESMRDDQNDIQFKIINQLKAQVRIKDNKIDSLTADNVNLEKQIYDMKIEKRLKNVPTTTAELEMFEDNTKKRVSHTIKIDRKTGMWIIGILIVAVLLIWLMMSITFPPIVQTTEAVTSSTSLLSLGNSKNISNIIDIGGL